MKNIFFIFLLAGSVSVHAQVILTGSAKHLDSASPSLNLMSVDSGTSLHIITNTNTAEVISKSAHYTIHSSNGLHLKDAAGNIVLQSQNKTFVSPTQTFKLVRAKGYEVALEDASGKIIAKGNYTMFHDRADITLEMDTYDEHVAALLAYQLSQTTRKIARGNTMLLTLSGVL